MNSDPIEGLIDHNEDRIRVFFTSEFRRNVRRLSKKYPRIRTDIQPILDQLLEGETPGEQIPRVRHPVYKVRLPNTDVKRGKRGGYRLIYYVQTSRAIILITIYSKTEQGDIAPDAISQIITRYEVGGETVDE